MIPYGKHYVDESDIDAVAEVLRSDFLTGGPVVDRFETVFGERVEAPETVVCASGTAALHLALLAVGVGEGDSVIVPSLTFLATANAVRLCGAEVIFCDVDADTGLMTVQALDEALNSSTSSRIKAAIPVHLNGQTAPMPEISALTEKHGLKVVEDACHALGTKYKRADGELVAVGSVADSDLACFSFHPVKTIAMGEGGAITARDSSYADRMRRLRSHGMERREAFLTCDALARDGGGRVNPWYYEMGEVGLNYRASDIHCALGLSQLGKFERFCTRRRELSALYDECLKPLAPVVKPVSKVPGCDPVLHLYAVQIDFDAAGITRGELMRLLKDKGVGTQVHYLPVHMQPYYRERYGELELPGARKYYDRCLSLPMFPAMEDGDVDYVIEVLKSLFLREGS